MDANAQVPYLLGNGSLNTFVSYDNKESIALKANYVKNKNLRGVIIWEITGDYLETSLGSGIIAATPLLDTLNSVFCTNNTSVCNAPSIINASSSSNALNLLWPSGTSSSFNIQYKKQTDLLWNTISSSINNVIIDSLDCNTIYEVKIQSVCGMLTSSFSAIQTFITSLCNLNCTMPTSIVTNATVNDCIVTWSNTGSTSYLIYYKKINETSWQSLTSSTNSTLINNLSSNTQYEIKIQSVCNTSSSAFSSVVNFTTNATSSICMYPLWNPSTIYLNGDTISYNNIIYRAKFWSQNNIPSNSYGNCCVWEYIMPCGGFTASTCYKPLWDAVIAYNAGNQVFWNGSVYKALWWTLNENPSNNSGVGAVWQIQTTNACQVNLHVKTFLQAYYSSINHTMNVTDSITVELHEDVPTNAYPLIESYKNILSQNGIINCIYSNNVFAKSCYIVLKHRNSLQTWSETPVLIQTNTSYDFSTAANKAYGSNQVEVETGIWAIYSGDINQDDIVDNSDFSLWETDANNFSSGYFVSDLDGNGSVDNADFSIWEANANAFVSVVKP